MHVIKLDGYNAPVDNGGKLELGTFGSYGEEQLQIVKAPDWVNLSVIATFNPPNRKPVQAVVDSVTGVIKVPKEAMADWYGVGTIVFVGLADGVQRISSDVEYIVRRHSNANGTEPAEPTPSVVEQILTEAQNANVNSAEAKKTATDAKDIAQRVRTDADNGKFNGKDGAKGDKGDDGTTPQLKIGEDNLWHVSYNNGATWVSLGVKATGAAGEDGADGLTPYIGENGNWWLGDTDTGVSAKGDKGDTGAKGADGVSPTASVTQTDDGAEFTVTDASGTTTATIRNGTNGKDGAPGAAGKDAVVDATLTQDGQAADAKVTGEKISQLKEDISNKITKFYASNQGETHLADSDNGKIMDMMLYGKSEQNQYKGINLLPTGISYREIIEVSIPKGTRIFWATDGTPALGGNFKFYNEDKTQEMWFGVDTGKTAMTATITIDAKYVEFLINEGQSVKICLGVGNDPVYEPYTGGQPSPSSDYPQEIKRVVNPTVKVTNKDGLKVQSVALNNITLNAIPVSSGGNVTINGQQYIADYVDVEKGKLHRKVKRLNLKDVDVTNITHGFHSNGNGFLSITIGNTDKEQMPISNRYKGSMWTQTSGYVCVPNDSSIVLVDDRFTDKQTAIKLVQDTYVVYALSTPTEEDLSLEQIKSLKSLSTNYPVTNITVGSEELDGYVVFNYPVSMANGWNYVKQQLNDNRDYIYDMDLQSAEAYVNSEYAVALTELEV